MSKIKAILFDSGKVLNEPATGHWFITPNFWKYVNREKFESIDIDKINKAFHEAGTRINTYNYITNLEEEYKCFVEFYETFSSNVPELELSVDEVVNLAEDLVFNIEKYVFFDDVFDVIPRLKQKCKLAVVSDAWPSILDVYDKNDLRKYFDSFIISSMIGACKPDKKMYETALDELKVSPEEAIFIDDNIKNCIGATELGIHSVLLCRDYDYYLWSKENYSEKELDIIHDLNELEVILKKENK